MDKGNTTKESGFAERFKEAIAFAGVKQVEFAQKIGAKPQNINNWLTGASEPNAQMFISMLIEFGHINWLYVFRGSQFGTVDSRIDLQDVSKTRDALEELRNQLKLEMEEKDKEWQAKLKQYEHEFLEREVKLLRQLHELLSDKKA